MLGASASARTLYRFAYALYRRFDRRFARYFQTQIAGNGVDTRRIKRDAAAIDGNHQPFGPAHFAEGGFFA